jgi:hypothetical protein
VVTHLSYLKACAFAFCSYKKNIEALPRINTLPLEHNKEEINFFSYLLVAFSAS